MEGKESRRRLIQVALCASSSVLRTQLESLLRADPRFLVVASTGHPAQLSDQTPADVAVVVVEPGETIPDTGMPLVVLSADPAPARRPVSLLPLQPSPHELAVAIEAAHLGLIVSHPAALTPVNSDWVVEELTPRELDVLTLLADGLGNKEIAARLAISDHTVKYHVSQILAKLGALSRTEAVSIGIRRGLVLL